MTLVDMLHIDPGWNLTIGLPKKEQAELYRKITADLGNEALEPEETANGWIVRWRPKENAR